MNPPRDLQPSDSPQGVPQGTPGPPASPVPPPVELDLLKLEAELAHLDLSRDEVNQVFRSAVGLLSRIDEPEQFVDGMLDEFSERLAELGDTPLVPPPNGGWDPVARRRLSLLVLYAGQAILLREKSQLFAHMREDNREMVRSSEQLKTALVESSESRRLLSSVLDTLPLGVAVLDGAGEVYYTNPTLRRLMGLTPQDVPTAADIRRAFDPDAALGRPGTADRSDVDITVAEGRARKLHRILQPLQLVPGEPIGWLLVAQDITEEQRMRDEMLRTNRLTAILDTAAALNHEINNPLAAILGRAQMLLARPDEHDPRTLAGLRVIEESARRIANLTNQLKEITEPAFTEYSRGVMMLDIKGSQKRTTSG